MTEQEKNDLDTLKAEILKRKVSAFDYMREVIRMTPELLKCTGHGTVERGIRFSLDSALREIETLTKAYIRKYPDEGMGRRK